VLSCCAVLSGRSTFAVMSWRVRRAVMTRGSRGRR
jgi:hypothetical protein